MYRNCRFLWSSLLALLSLPVEEWSAYVAAISPAEILEERSLLPPGAGVFSQGPRSVPAEADPAIAFISGRQVPSEGDSSGPSEDDPSKENSEGTTGGPAENETSGREPEQEGAATEQARTNAGGGRLQVLERRSGVQRLLQRALRRKARPGRGQGNDEPETLYRNSIRSCISSPVFDRVRFCEETGSPVVCEQVLQAFQQTKGLANVRIRPLAFSVKRDGGLIRVAVPFFDNVFIKILMLLYYYLTEKCRYEAKVMPFALTCYEDAVDANADAQVVWSWSPRAGGSSLASTALPPDRLNGLYLLDGLLVGMLVQVGSMSRASPTMARIVNFACRWNSFCRPVMREILLKLLPAGLPRTIESAEWLSQDLVKTMKGLLAGLLSRKLSRLQNKIALALSTWLSESVRTMR